MTVLYYHRKKASCLGSPEPAYIVAAQDSDNEPMVPGGGNYVIQSKDHMELVHLGEPVTYGAMWRSRPPSYNTDTPPRTTPGSPIQQHPTSPRPNQKYTTVTAQIGMKVMPDGRLQANSHMYESPRFIPKEMLPDMIIPDHDNG